MIVELLDLKPRNPYLSLAIEEAMSRIFGGNKEFTCAVRVWSNPPSVILGRTCDPEKNLTSEFLKSFDPSMKKTRWMSRTTLCRRPSGGGTVLHGPGNINYSIFFNLKAFPALYDLKNSYRSILSIVQKSLRVQGFECSLEGLSDLVMEFPDGSRKKISGNAQFRKNGILTHHGTLITRENLIDSVSELLLHPPVEPEYREGRSHRSFIGSLPDHFDLTSFYNLLTSELMRFTGIESKRSVDDSERKEIFIEARKLVKEIYVKKEWILKGKIAYGKMASAEI